MDLLKDYRMKSPHFKENGDLVPQSINFHFGSENIIPPH